MTHTGHMKESDGTLGEWKKSSHPCPKCGSDEHYYRSWESSDGAYEDEKHHCFACGDTQWIDGPDA